MSNICDYSEIGAPGDDIWLEGQIVEEEFIFSGRLFLHDGSAGTIIDGFSKGPVPAGWTKRPRVDGEGYELLNSRVNGSSHTELTGRCASLTST
jgi:hypothetical protein